MRKILLTLLLPGMVFTIAFEQSVARLEPQPQPVVEAKLQPQLALVVEPYGQP